MKVCGDFISVVIIIQKKKKRYAEMTRNKMLPYPSDILTDNI